MKHVVCKVEEMEPGSKRSIRIGSREVVLVMTGSGEYCAMRNVCPHQGARLSDGELTGTTLPSCAGEYTYGKEGGVLRCPWHRWEFDVSNGQSLFPDPRSRVKSYEVTVEDGHIVLHD
ncbi:Rieske (2Fe-2S) protein [Paenibacillus sp. IB182496]|uniref:Rieske (2Fe-2S) protein n=1 Tax=Paenibacillus sabuli TaxID=2772509 RepID=A0A927GR23_9BACL|nr:Rieske (2Fe-2S) protein [Paenibacillus sabuli]MBD2844352.1 Rieske (2Fe-2S) protein [Paenibacillus sabuli]